MDDKKENYENLEIQGRISLLKMQQATTGYTCGILTLNEARQMVDEKPIEDGNKINTTRMS